MKISLTGQEHFMEKLVSVWSPMCIKLNESISNRMNAKDQFWVSDISTHSYNNFDWIINRRDEKPTNFLVAISPIVDQCTNGDIPDSSLKQWCHLLDFLCEGIDRQQRINQIANKIRDFHFTQIQKAIKAGYIPESTYELAKESFPNIWGGLKNSVLKVNAWNALTPEARDTLSPLVKNGFKTDQNVWDVLGNFDSISGVEVTLRHAWRALALNEDSQQFFSGTSFTKEGTEAIDSCMRWLDLTTQGSKPDQDLQNAVNAMNRLAILKGYAEFRPLLDMN